MRRGHGHPHRGLGHGTGGAAKTVTSFQEGAAFVLLNHEDTNDLTPGEYAYDVQLTAKDGMVATIIPPARFVLEGDVTRD